MSATLYTKAQKRFWRIVERRARGGLRSVGKCEDPSRLAVDRADKNGAALLLMVRKHPIPEVGEPMHPREIGVPDPHVVTVDGRMHAPPGQRLEGRGL